MMKNLIKKLKPFIKRSFAFVAAFLVLVCNFIMPVSALDYTYDPTKQVMLPLFDYDYIEIIYNDGKRACFNLKDAFYDVPFWDGTEELSFYLTSADDTTKMITYTLQGINFRKVSYQVDGVLLNAPYYNYEFRFVVSGQDISQINIHIGESIYDASFYSTIYDSYPDTIEFRRQDQYQVGTSSVTHLSNFYYPTFTYKDGAVVGRSLDTLPLSFSSSNIGGTINVSPRSLVENLESYLPEAIDRKLIYFSDTHFNVSVPSDAYTFVMDIHYIPSSIRVDYKTYHDLYFPSYYTEGITDFSGWISTALGGFLSFQFAPGLSIGALLLFIIGIGAMNIFLKFFAGG